MYVSIIVCWIYIGHCCRLYQHQTPDGDQLIHRWAITRRLFTLFHHLNNSINLLIVCRYI